MTIRRALFAVAVLAGCQGPATSTDDAMHDAAIVDGTNPDVPILDAPTGNSAPIILSAATNTQTLHEQQTLIISVIATDPDGIDDLIGGTVRVPGGAAYGALMTSAQEGSYSLSLTWAALHVVDAIDTPPGGSARTFEIEMFDASGASARANVAVQLACSTPTHGLCGGACTNLDVSATHCGTCGFDCTSSLGGSLAGGACEVDATEHFCRKFASLYVTAANPDATCTQLCAEAGGAQAFSTVLDSSLCGTINALCGTDGMGNVPCTSSLSDLPSQCVTGETAIRCLCTGYYLSPG